MNIHRFKQASDANEAAADLVASKLLSPDCHSVMVAAGNTPLDLYRLISEKQLTLAGLNVFALDEYVGVPLEEPRNCANLMHDSVANPWKISPSRFHTISSLEHEALESVQRHERLISGAGGLDLIILGLGQNGHIGFNEPGSSDKSPARVLDLETISIDANRKWFQGKYAPSRGVTTGMPTILSARCVIILAYGAHKAKAVADMAGGPATEKCPASYLQNHPDAHLFVDAEASAGLP